MAVLVAQSIGIIVTVSRNRQRQVANASPSVSLPVPNPITPTPGMARRRFLKLAGGAVLAGVAVGGTATLVACSQSNTATNTTASNSGVSPSSGATATPATVASSNSATVSTAQTTTVSGTVLATVSSLALGKALAFTTPDTHQNAFLVHRTDGSVACFSGICTHEPVNLVYNEAQQTLYCPRHSVPFETQNGSPEQGPARTALKKYAVTIDNSGNIIYG